MSGRLCVFCFAELPASQALPADERKGFAFPLQPEQSGRLRLRWATQPQSFFRTFRKGLAFPLIGRRSREEKVKIAPVEQRLEIQIPKGAPKTRLEDFLFERFPNLSRMYLRRIVRDEKCEVNGRLENVGYRLRPGDFVEVEVDLTRENSMRPEDVPLDIVFEDAHLVVVNKPAGMLVHPTNRDKNGTLLNALVFHLNGAGGISDWGSGIADFDSSAIETSSPGAKADLTKSAIRDPRSEIKPFIRPGLVHRLDKQTSGLMVIAKSVRIHRSLSRLFQRKYVEKKYLALVDGIVKQDNGTINGSIGRIAEEKRWDLKDGGKNSETRFTVRERRADSTLLELEPVTGRTNQLRIHCASIGHPIVGDVMRGGSEFERLCLHAWKLSFRHPIGNLVHLFERPLDFSRDKV